MNMDYEPMWRVVDAHRRCADELERTLREFTGDQPVPECDDPIHVYHQSAPERDDPIPVFNQEPERDDIELYRIVIRVLQEARDQLHSLADRKGHSVRRLDASRCRVFAGRCDQVIDQLWKSGSL